MLVSVGRPETRLLCRSPSPSLSPTCGTLLAPMAGAAHGPFLPGHAKGHSDTGNRHVSSLLLALLPP